MSMASLMQIRLVIVSIQTSKSLDLVLDHGYGVGSASWNVRLPRALRVTLATMKTTTWWSPEPCGGRWSVARVARGAAALAKCRGYNCRHRAHWTPRRRAAWPRCCHCRDLHCSWRCETSVPSNDSDSKQPSIIAACLGSSSTNQTCVFAYHCLTPIHRGPHQRIVFRPDVFFGPDKRNLGRRKTAASNRANEARAAVCVANVCEWERAASKMNVE